MDELEVVSIQYRADIVIDAEDHTHSTYYIKALMWKNMEFIYTKAASELNFK